MAPLGRAGEDDTKLYLLLERTIGGCSVPIVYALPDQHSVIRELGQEGRAPKR